MLPFHHRLVNFTLKTENSSMFPFCCAAIRALCWTRNWTTSFTFPLSLLPPTHTVHHSSHQSICYFQWSPYALFASVHLFTSQTLVLIGHTTRYQIHERLFQYSKKGGYVGFFLKDDFLIPAHSSPTGFTAPKNLSSQLFFTFLLTRHDTTTYSNCTWRHLQPTQLQITKHLTSMIASLSLSTSLFSLNQPTTLPNVHRDTDELKQAKRTSLLEQNCFEATPIHNWSIPTYCKQLVQLSW